MPRRAGLGMATPATRALFGVLGVAALGLAAVSACGFLSSLYSSAAHDIVASSRGRVDSLGVAALAVRMAPWRAEPHTLMAQSLSARQPLDDALNESEAALRLHPASAYGWVYHARLQGAAGRYDAMLNAYGLALQRAPQSPYLHDAIAFDGVLGWRHGNAELRKLWLNSMAYALRYRRLQFLYKVALYGRDPYFCAATRERLPIDRWCNQIARTRADCSRPALPAKAEQWCRAAGLLPQARTGRGP